MKRFWVQLTVYSLLLYTTSSVTWVNAFHVLIEKYNCVHTWRFWSRIDCDLVTSLPAAEYCCSDMTYVADIETDGLWSKVHTTTIKQHIWVGAWPEIECCYSTITRIPLLAHRMAECRYKSKLEERYSNFTTVLHGKRLVSGNTLHAFYHWSFVAPSRKRDSKYFDIRWLE